MTYNPNIPQASNKVSQSQSNLLTNFGQLDAIFDNDHFKFSSATNNGLHKQIQLPVIPAVPSVSGAGAALYTAADTGGKTQLFYKNLAQTIQLTAVYGTLAAATNSFIVLPGGVIVAWGNDTQCGVSGSGQYTINYNGASGVTFTNVFTVQLSSVNNILSSGSSAMISNLKPVGGTYNLRGFDQNNIYYFTSSGSIVAVNWLAIGN